VDHRTNIVLARLPILACVVLAGAQAFAQAQPAPGPGKSASPSAEEAARVQRFLEAKPLTPGDAAPELTGLTWLKGEGFTKFEPGTVYVLDMWATWCLPCIKGIPHISDLARKHAKDNVKVVGISVWEEARELSPPHESFLSRVRTFVANQGDAMAYDVAFAPGDSSNASSGWMERAGRSSIPTAFVVDGKGKVAWMGHPMNGLDRVVEEVLAGTFDVEAEAARLRAQEHRQREGQRLQQALQPAVAGKDWPKAIEIYDKLLELDSEMFAGAAIAKLRTMLLEQRDASAALAFAQSSLEGPFRSNAGVLRAMAETYLQHQKPEEFPPDLTVALAARAVAVAQNDDVRFDLTLAKAQHRAGKHAQAIGAIDKVLARVPDTLRPDFESLRAKAHDAMMTALKDAELTNNAAQAPDGTQPK
jgi:thiol-disulfide isomerase/thioredoxin